MGSRRRHPPPRNFEPNILWHITSLSSTCLRPDPIILSSSRPCPFCFQLYICTITFVLFFVGKGCHPNGIPVYYGHDEAFRTSYCGADAWHQWDGHIFANYIREFAPDVVLANWALIHRMWMQTMDEMNAFVDKLAGHLDDMVASGVPLPRYRFWLSAPAIASEREPHCVLERGIMYSAALRRVLEPRGWVEIDWLAMTTAWGLHIRDGLHPGPMHLRMSMNLILHHICHGEG
ncbi:unnamed protein product [Choristocarpus tenellus]